MIKNTIRGKSIKCGQHIHVKGYSQRGKCPTEVKAILIICRNLRFNREKEIDTLQVNHFKCNETCGNIVIC